MKNIPDLAPLMRILILILSFTSVLSSTQSIWDLVCKTLATSCGVSACESTSCIPQEEKDCNETPNRQCCPSFQCCFLAFAGFSTPYQLDLQVLTPIKTRPSEWVGVLHSSFTSDCFHPPDFAFSTS